MLFFFDIRIVGIICIARYFDNVQYVHSKVTKIEHINHKRGYIFDIKDFFDGYTSKEYVKKIENYFNFNQQFDLVESHQYTNVIEVFNPTLDDIHKYQNLNESTLMKIFMPYIIFEADLKIYAKTMPYLKSILQSQPRSFYSNNDNNNKTNIAVHVRRGDILEKKNAVRYTSSEDAYKIIKNLNILYSNCSIFIFTEMTENNKNEFKEIISENSNVFLKADIDVLSTFDHLIQADVLILSKSSFSHLAALYNTKGIVYSTNFWHRPLDTWFDIKALIKS